MTDVTKRNLPDVALNTKSRLETKINRVGMSSIELPVLIEIAGDRYRCPAKAAAYVSLDQVDVKGIHMSRLFSRLQKLSDRVLSAELLSEIVRSFQESHDEMSRSSELRLSFELMMKRQSLISNMVGWRHYPINISLNYENNKIEWKLDYQVVYSSTCPCSAALARQLIQEKFLEDFSKKDSVNKDEIHSWLSKEEAICATPHSQRSIAKIEATYSVEPKDLLGNIRSLIESTEARLGTPVQSFVKREDEQEFARLNGENLMFCEDAARRIQALLKESIDIASYSIEVEHQESLHPHNAVARVWS